MSDEFQADLPAADTSVEPFAPSISDIASNAIDLAFDREAKRAAGEKVPDELPDAAPARARDEHGKFAPKPKESAPRPAAEAAPQPATNQPQAQPVASATQALPMDWNDAQKAVFGGLTPDAQKLILDQRQRQDADYTRKTQEVADTRRQYEPVVQALAPHVQYLNDVGRQLGQAPAAMVSNIVAFERTLRTSGPDQRAAALAQLIREYPVDLQLLNRALGQAPQVQTPAPILNELRQTQAELQALRERARQQDLQQETSSAQSLIDNARTAKDETGQPKYPHFDAVRELMRPLVLQGATFDQAYQTAAAPVVAVMAARGQAAQAADQARAASVARAQGARSPRTSGTTPGGSVAASSMDARISGILDAVGIV